MCDVIVELKIVFLKWAPNGNICIYVFALPYRTYASTQGEAMMLTNAFNMVRNVWAFGAERR